MKQLTIRSVSLLLALLMVLLMIPTVNAYTVSDWASTEVGEMRDMGLIPDSLMNSDLNQRLSRLNMCRIAVLAYEKLTGTTIKVQNKTPFSDTTDPDVAKAYAVGLVQGSNGKFNPKDPLTREHFVAFMAQFLEAVDYPVSESDYADLSTFYDAPKISNWVKKDAQLAVGLGIIQGYTGHKLRLENAATAEQALVMFHRTYFIALKGLKDPYADASSWAKDALDAMDELGLVPDTVAYSSMKGNITRLDMCRIVMNTYWFFNGGYSDMGAVDKSPFRDTDNIDIINAYRLEIVSGDGNGNFRPNDPITRQEFFKITHNFLNALGYLHQDDDMVNLAEYPDSNELNSNYAVAPTRVLIALGIIEGDNNKNLNPRDNIVSQEALVIFHRSYEFIMNWNRGDEENPDDNRSEEDLTTIEKVIALALEIEADDSLWYVYGGKKPSDGGFDCSGFVSYVYNQKAGTNFYPPVSSIWKAIPDSNIIPRDKLLPGDIVFFWDDSKTGFQHVGLYIGDGKFVHAANSRKGIIISELDEPYYLSHYMDAKRVFN